MRASVICCDAVRGGNCRRAGAYAGVRAGVVMRLFKCQSCGQVLFFENRMCGRCGHQLGFIPQQAELSALEPDVTHWTALAAPAQTWRFCHNSEFQVCNWLIDAATDEQFCVACRHNRTVPDRSRPENVAAWGRMELAKHRLFYTLLRLGLPTPNRADEPKGGLVFDFLADPATTEGPKVMTGHDEGLITLALAEADDAEREARRARMGEPYRTLLGHFRHEVGHFYWDRLVRDRHQQDAFRMIFGDDRADYNAALKRHYEQGPPPNWQENFVSAYATAHAWEDWAETWAHYLHIVDGLETARAFDLEIRPDIDTEGVLHTQKVSDPYSEPDFNRLAETWLPLTIALNAMNQSMGQGDLYPFVLSPAVISKLAFIHDIVRAERMSADPQA